MPTGTQQSIEGIFCSVCIEIIGEEPSVHSDNVCRDCDDTYSNYCHVCNESYYDYDCIGASVIGRIRASGITMLAYSNAQDTGDSICEECWHSCDNCGGIYQYDDNAYDCCDRGPSNLYNYSYRPTPEFYEVREDGLVHSHFGAISGVLYMGIELEIAKMCHHVDDFVSSNRDNAHSTFVYFKEDASIGEDGAELVTMPATLEAFERVFPFDLLDEARRRGARSFHYQSCGFHVHVSRSAFSATHMWRFIKFQLNCPKLCQSVAQREDSSYATWHYEDSERNSLPDYVKGKRSNGRRYLAINFQNHATVELRYFKGNILRAAIMKNVEFVQSVYDYTKNMSFQQVVQGHLSEFHYKQWLYSQDSYPNLRFFLDNNCNQESE
jgi:hypothetical protein